MRQWTVDAFASQPFRGNPAAVVEPLESWPDDGWMQALAEENKHAETAYLLRAGGSDRYALRWFTPAKEVELCGHATLAAAHVLFTEFAVAAPRITFETRWAGELTVERRPPGYSMDFPASVATPVSEPSGLAEALGLQPAEVLESRFLLVRLDDEAGVRGLKPDITALSRFGEAKGARGNVIVCAEADADAPYQVISRFFAPGSGIPEDPATGAAHCILAPYWTSRLGRPELDFHQAYPGRGGDLRCRVQGDRVLIEGRAVTVMEAVLRA